MNVTSEMVEAASVAMCDGFEVKWTDLHQHEREQHRKIMRAALEAAIALMRGQSWQPIETAPKDAEWWLVWSWLYQRPAVVTKRSDNGIFWDGDWDYNVLATHWKPLPAPPKDTADEQ